MVGGAASGCGSGEWSRQQLDMFTEGGFVRAGQEWLPPCVPCVGGSKHLFSGAADLEQQQRCDCHNGALGVCVAGWCS